MFCQNSAGTWCNRIFFFHTAPHCSTPQHTATQHTATHCNTLQYTATHCNTLQHTATHVRRDWRNRSSLARIVHTATHCNTLQHNGTHRNTLHHTCDAMDAIVSPSRTQWTHYQKLQHSAPYCNTPTTRWTQSHHSRTHSIHTATYCNMLQHTATHLWRNGRNRVSLACTVHALLYFDSNALDHMSKPMHVGSTAFYFVRAGKNVRNSEWDSPAHVQQMQCVFVQWECKMEKEIKWKISCEVRVVETSLMR